MPNYSVILAAAGRSSRFLNRESTSAVNMQTKKTFVSLNGRPVWLHSAEMFGRHPDVTQLIIVLAPDDAVTFEHQFAKDLNELRQRLTVNIVIGGNERADSIEQGLAAVAQDVEFIVIHDAARPCFDMALLNRVLTAAKKCGAAIPVTPINSTIKRSRDGKMIDATVERDSLFLAQTPQVFQRELIIELYRKRNGVVVTDEAQLAEKHGVPVAIVEGSPLNLKITTAADLQFAEVVVGSAMRKILKQPEFDLEQ